MPDPNKAHGFLELEDDVLIEQTAALLTVAEHVQSTTPIGLALHWAQIELVRRGIKLTTITGEDVKNDYHE